MTSDNDNYQKSRRYTVTVKKFTNKPVNTKSKQKIKSTHNDDLRLANGALAQDNSALQREVEILNDLLKRHERNNDQSN